MPLFVQGSSLHTVDVSDETTVGNLKDILGPSEGISSEDQLLTYGGIPLEDESLVCEVVPEMGTVTLTTRIRGGIYFMVIVNWNVMLLFPLLRQGARISCTCR